MSTSDLCCCIDAIVTVDSKGQIVIPKEIRERVNLKPNSKIALITIEKESNVECILIVKVEGLNGAVSEALSSGFKKAIK